MKISQVHLSLTIQYASDAIGKLGDLITARELDEGRVNVTIEVAKTALERALQSLDEISISPEEG